MTREKVIASLNLAYQDAGELQKSGDATGGVLRTRIQQLVGILSPTEAAKLVSDLPQGSTEYKISTTPPKLGKTIPPPQENSAALEDEDEEEQEQEDGGEPDPVLDEEEQEQEEEILPEELGEVEEVNNVDAYKKEFKESSIKVLEGKYTSPQLLEIAKLLSIDTGKKTSVRQLIALIRANIS